MPIPTRALSVQQPWAELIRAGIKDVENRSWRTYHRGPIAIHASRTFDAHANVPAQGRTVLGAIKREALALGAIIAVAQITHCHRHDCPGDNGMCSPWAVRGEWHWVLASVRALEAPIPIPGHLGLWDMPAEVQAALRDQLAT